jgi:hypothetical protein
VAVLQVCSPATPPLTPNPGVPEYVEMEDEVLPVVYFRLITNVAQSEKAYV